MTVVGAVLGAQLLTMIASIIWDGGEIGLGGVLGLIVVFDSASSPLVLAVWLLSMVVLHLLQRKLRKFAEALGRRRSVGV